MSNSPLDVRPDFLNLSELIAPETRLALAKVRHEITDTFGNLISAHESNALPAASVELKIETKTVARLRAMPSELEILSALVQASLGREFAAAIDRSRLEDSDLLTTDLDQLLDLSEREDMPFEDLLRHCLRLLRTHVWVERCSLFGIYDGFTLEGLAGLGGEDQANWKINFSSVAGVAATSRKPYHSENPESDPNFRRKDGIPAPRNLLCYPLLHGETLVGVMNLSGRLGGPFSPSDFRIVERFSNVAAHILQKHYFKKRMQSFERTSDHLGKYLSSKVVKNVKTQDQLALGGVEKKVVCLFADIRGYTTITEGIAAATLVKLLNFHFERMHEVIEKNEGTLDKIVGDLVMAVWNIPHDQPDPELLALKTALEMQKEMIRVVAPEWERHGVPRVGMGIGLNSGTAVAGNLGSARYMNYTVIGDTINTCQRLESKAKAGEIWMAEKMFEVVQGKTEKPARKECAIKLKGKEETIDCYVYRPLRN